LRFAWRAQQRVFHAEPEPWFANWLEGGEA